MMELNTAVCFARCQPNFVLRERTGTGTVCVCPTIRRCCVFALTARLLACQSSRQDILTAMLLGVDFATDLGDVVAEGMKEVESIREADLKAEAVAYRDEARKLKRVRACVRVCACVHVGVVSRTVGRR